MRRVRVHTRRNPYRKPESFEGRIVRAIGMHVSEKTGNAKTLVTVRKSLKMLVEDDKFWSSMNLLKKATKDIGQFMEVYFG